MKKTIKAIEVKTTAKTKNWRGITDEDGIFYNTNDPEHIKYIARGGTYEIEYETKTATKGKYKGKPQNKITDLRILTVAEQEGVLSSGQEQTGEVVAQGGSTRSNRGTTSPLAVVSEKHEVTPVQQRPATPQDYLLPLIPTVGTIETTEEQRNILFAPVDKEAVEIRPDGLIYLPWMEYATRLRKAFGTNWGLIGAGAPYREGIYVYWPHYLIIKGKLSSGPAVGGQEYYPNNPKMTWGDALEGAKSNALMRLCKGLGMSLELWQPKFIKEWIDEHAESYPLLDDKGKKKLDRNGNVILRWRKKK